MSEQSTDPNVRSHNCVDWAAIVELLEKFPTAEVSISEGGPLRTSWVFRGLADSRFQLEPTIERHARQRQDDVMPWIALEKLATEVRMSGRRTTSRLEADGYAGRSAGCRCAS